MISYANAAMNFILGNIPIIARKRRDDAERAEYEAANIASYEALMADGFQPWPYGSLPRRDEFSPYSHEFVAMTRVQPGKIWERRVTINRISDLAPEMNVAQMWWKPADGFDRIIDGELVTPPLMLEAR